MKELFLFFKEILRIIKIKRKDFHEFKNSSIEEKIRKVSLSISETIGIFLDDCITEKTYEKYKKYIFRKLRKIVKQTDKLNKKIANNEMFLLNKGIIKREDLKGLFFGNTSSGFFDYIKDLIWDNIYRKY